jgi:hypothetical protein
LDIPLGQVFGDLAHEVDGAVAGNQAPDVFVVGKVQGSGDFA